VVESLSTTKGHFLHYNLIHCFFEITLFKVKFSHPLGLTVLPSEDIVQQILWELYEVNFIHKLLSLDCCACTDLDLKNSMQLLERQLKILTCFSLSLF